MFIADYGNKQGWEIFSNTTSTPMVLVKSEEGSFDDISCNPSHPIHDILNNCAQKIWEIKNSNSDEVSPVNYEWKLYNTDLNTYAYSAAADTYDIGDGYENYQFILSSDVTTTKNVYEPKGGRLKTKWGQGSYFNQCTPFYGDEANQHTYVGCVPVAFGQFLYHSHYNFGQPMYTVTDAAYDSSKNTYSFSGMSSTIWDSFNTDLYWNFFPNDMKPTAVFLGHIGVSIGVHYGKRYNYPNDKDKHDGTSSDLRYSKCIEFIENQANLKVEIVDLEQKYVISNLEKGYPVVAQVFLKNDSYGHAFLIDHCDTEMTSFYNYYTPTILPPRCGMT